jgi:hypothetical protein
MRCSYFSWKSCVFLCFQLPTCLHIEFRWNFHEKLPSLSIPVSNFKHKIYAGYNYVHMQYVPSIYIYIHIYMYKRLVKLRFIIFITQFQATVKICQVLTCCRNVNCVVGQKRVSNPMFQCIVSIMWVLIFWYWYVDFSILHKGCGLRLTICSCYSSQMALNIGFDNI